MMLTIDIRPLRWVPFLAIAALSGCDAIFGDGYDVRLQTDASQYMADTTTTMSLTIENRSDKVVYYLCAGDFALERLDDGDSVDYFGFGNCQCLCPRPIDPGESIDRSFGINDAMLDWIGGGPHDDKTSYRFRLRLYEDEEFDVELSDDDQVSNEFAIIDVAAK